MTIVSIYGRLRRISRLLEDGAVAGVFFALMLVACAKIILRLLGIQGMAWGEALCRYLVLWIGMLGAMIATRENNHIAINLVSFLGPGRLGIGARMLSHAFAAATCGVLTWASVLFLKDEIEAKSMAFASVPTYVMELILPLAFAVMALRFALYAVKHLSEIFKKTSSGLPVSVDMGQAAEHEAEHETQQGVSDSTSGQIGDKGDTQNSLSDRDGLKDKC